MIDATTYFDNFTPNFNEARFQELMEVTPTKFQTDRGQLSIPKRLVKSILVSIKFLTGELDRNNIYYGGEGAGKSHTVFQHTYVWWWCLNELGLINYEFGMHLIYGRLSDLKEAMDMFSEIPYMIYSLDESNEINRKNWAQKTVKDFMSHLRTGRKNLRIVNFTLPALEEMLPSIALSRINWIFEQELDVDKDFNLIKGEWRLMNVPVGRSYYSMMNYRSITRKEVKQYLNKRFYDKDLLFESLPKRLLSFTGKSNKVFMFDKDKYKAWARSINKKAIDEENSGSDLEKKQKRQRDLLIRYCIKELKIKQKIVGELIDMDRSSVGEIARKGEGAKN